MFKNTLRVATAVAFASALLVSAGCSSGSRSKSNASTTAPTTSTTTAPTTTGVTTTPPPATGNPALDLASVPLQNAPNAAEKMGPDTPALVVTVTNSGNTDVDVSDFTISSAGSIDESTDIGELKVYGDDNKNGMVDQGEPVLVTIPAPAFTADDGNVQIALPAAVTLAAGADLQLVVTVDTTAATAAAGVATIGKTVVLSVDSAADLSVTYNGTPVTPTGGFPVGGDTVTLYLNDHLLISEVVPTGGEFIEIFNPTAQTIDLVNYYLTEQSDTTGTTAYWNLPTGANFDSGSTSDFFVRFPPGSTIAPGQAITIAVDGVEFQTAYNSGADYACRNPAGGSAQLLTHNGTSWSLAAIGAFASIFDTGEPVVLLFWDGTTDLVQDVDYIFFGNPASVSSFNFQFDKTGVSIDGPDADTTPTQYLPETPAAQQSPAPVQNAPNNSVQRVDYSEGTQVNANGNGITGNDETSEDTAATFVNAAPTPGAP